MIRTSVRYTPGIYIFIKDMDTIYIGRSIQMELRIKQHKIKDYDYYVMIPYESSLQRSLLERYLIMLIEPSMNKMHTGRVKSKRKLIQ